MNDVSKTFWEATYKHTIAKMIGVCYRYTYDRQIAEDLAHDAFLLAIDKSSSFENKGPIEAWLRRIVVNVALQYLREQKRQQRRQERIAYDAAMHESADESQSNDEGAFSETELLEIVRSLPEHHKIVFNLYVFENFTHAQIAAELGISEGTSKSHLARARKKIRQILLEKASDSKKQKRLLILLWLPNKLWDIDYWFVQRLGHLELQPQARLRFKNLDFTEARIPEYIPSSVPSHLNFKTDISSATLVLNLAATLGIYFLSNGPTSAPVATESRMAHTDTVAQVDEKNNNTNKIEKTDTKTATFLENRIISTQKPVKNNDMKNLNFLSTLLLSSSTLAFDSTKPISTNSIPVHLASYLNAEKQISELAKQITVVKSDSIKDSSKLFGSFYASEVFFSAKDNGLYLKGKNVRVNLNSQKFTGSGTFSFINKIDLLIVEGRPMKLDETVDLSDKKYSLIKLPQKEAISKYGNGKELVVEIKLDE
jgi:RNA polymerase sigma factor (sigma-70 family)